MFGSMVVKGCAPVLAMSSVVHALKNVDLPAEGLPWKQAWYFYKKWKAIP